MSLHEALAIVPSTLKLCPYFIQCKCKRLFLRVKFNPELRARMNALTVQNPRHKCDWKTINDY